MVGCPIENLGWIIFENSHIVTGTLETADMQDIYPTYLIGSF